MTYPLAEMTRRVMPNRRREIRLPRITPTKAQADDLAREYLRVVSFWRNVGVRLLAVYDPPALTTDTVPEVEAELARAAAAANTLAVSMGLPVGFWAERLARWHRGRWASGVKVGTGLSVDALMSSAVVRADIEAALAWNIQLVRSVSDTTRDRIASVIWAGFRARTPRREVARQIAEAVAISRRRALRIAVDQTTKLSGDLDRARMLEAGLDDWVWRHSGKAHPRPEHVARNGKRYSWTNPPEDKPGDLPYCGCKAQGVIDL